MEFLTKEERQAQLEAKIEEARRTGEPMKLHAAGGSAYAVCFGDLARAGLMHKSRYNASRDPDDIVIEWYLPEDAGFSVEDNWGNILKPGESVEWEK